MLTELGTENGVWHVMRTSAVIGLALALAGCGQSQVSQSSPKPVATTSTTVEAGSSPLAAVTSSSSASGSSAVPMGKAKSVTTFFVTSIGLGNGGNLGGLAGADAHCQALAAAAGAGDHTWRAYLSAAATSSSPAINARDRIGSGPWHNADGFLIANNVDDLHGATSNLDKDNIETENADSVSSDAGPNRHEILTGSQPDGTAFAGTNDLTCSNWTSNSAGHAEVGHGDRTGASTNGASWNSAATTQGCSQTDFQATGGAGLFYCFATD